MDLGILYLVRIMGEGFKDEGCSHTSVFSSDILRACWSLKGYRVFKLLVRGGRMKRSSWSQFLKVIPAFRFLLIFLARVFAMKASCSCLSSCSMITLLWKYTRRKCGSLSSQGEISHKKWSLSWNLCSTGMMWLLDFENNILLWGKSMHSSSWEGPVR